jgi:hypothetical protein
MNIRPRSALISIAALAAAGCSQQAPGNGAAAAVAAGSAPASGFAFAADPCQVVMNATLAVLQHDHVDQMTLPTGAGKTARQAQSVQVGGKTYIQVNDAWTESPMSIADEIKMVNDESKTAHSTCKPSGADAIGGQPVAIYDAHVVNEGSTSDNRLWIALASGLPLKIESHLDTGDISTQLLRYDNVTAPANVQARPG